MTPVLSLTEDHKIARLSLSDLILSYNYNQLPPIIFTDESTVVKNLNTGGIWREYGHHPPESFYNQEQRPLSVMIWGIGQRGFRTPLFYFNTHVNSQSYMKYLLDNGVWQQINAPFTYVQLHKRIFKQNYTKIIAMVSKKPRSVSNNRSGHT